MEQQLNLFGEEVIETSVKRIGRNERFEDYDAFIDKHEIRKRPTIAIHRQPFMR